MADAFGLIAADLTAIVDGLGAMARKHRRTACVGRTYGQHAAPITFGAVAGAWLGGIAETAADLPALRDKALVASLGGPVGTLSGLGEDAARVGAALRPRTRPRLRAGQAGTPIAAAWSRSATWLATLIASLAKMATDVVFLSATEVGEVSRAPHGRAAAARRRCRTSAIRFRRR